MTLDERFIDPKSDHLHHTGALRYFEEERYRIWREHGLSTGEFISRFNIKLFVYDLEMRYRQQLRVGDNVVLSTRLYNPRRTILSFHQSLEKESVTAVEGVIHLVVVNLNDRPTPVPQQLLEMLIGTPVSE